MSDNLNLWRRVERTDPAHVKPITGKSYKGNSPKPHFLVFKATETFGPIGIGWGFEIVDEKLLDGALIAPGFNERIHMARVRVWFEWEGKRGAVEHVGQTVFCGKRNSGQPFTDEDAPKKSVTDALVKALSMIGFAGDIFMGRYDDSKYVAEIKRQIEAEAVEPEKPAEMPPDQGDNGQKEFIAASLAMIRSKTDGKALREWWQSDEHRDAMTDFGLDRDQVDSLKAAVQDRLVEIGRRADDAAPTNTSRRMNGNGHSAGYREGART